MNRYMLGFLFSLILFSFNYLEAHAATTVLSNCSESTVQAAINGSSDGDTVTCPAGAWTWGSTVTINNKNITLQGQGIGKSIITMNVCNGILVPETNTKPFRITGFTFMGTKNCSWSQTYSATIAIKGGVNWRFDNNKVLMYSDRTSWSGGDGIFVQNQKSGVIDHNRFGLNPSSGTNCWHTAIVPFGVNSKSAPQWDLPSSIGGSSNTLFIEDNYFDEPNKCSSHVSHAVDASSGGIYVFRKNTLINAETDAHGFCKWGGGSAREYEVSDNDFYVTIDGGMYTIIQVRGGTGVIYNNRLHLSPGVSAHLFVSTRNAQTQTDHRIVGIGTLAGYWQEVTAQIMKAIRV